MTFKYYLLAAAVIASPGAGQVKPKTPPLPPEARVKLLPPMPLNEKWHWDDFKYRFDLEHGLAYKLAETAEAMKGIEHDLKFGLAHTAELFKYKEHDLAFELAHAAEAVKSIEHDFGFTQGPESFKTTIGLRRPQQWYQGDPADSLYRAAYSFFSRQEYKSAADRYSDLRTKYPTSRYFCDAAYYEAFARYRLGSVNDLRTAYRVLDGMSSRCTTRSRNEDVPELAARVNSALARQGDADAAERVKRAASQGQNVCDQEERSVKIEAMSALAQMDPQAANPVLRTVLATKDACSIPIRRQAIALVARRNDAEAVSILGQIAKSDTDRETQLEAVRGLGRMSNDAAFAALEEFLRTSNDERVQIEAANTMARSDHPRAQAGVRTLIERNDVAERIRVSAVNSLASRSNLATEYWRTLYTKVESDNLRTAVVNAIAKINTDDAQAFLLGIARDPAQASQVRHAATSKIAATASIADLYRLFQGADSRPIRQIIVSGLAARREPEATDRLIDIAKSGTDPDVRQSAIRALSRSPRKEDPKVIKAMADILGCCQ